MGFFDSVSNVVNKVTETASSGYNKIESGLGNPTLNKFVPITSLYTGQGRENFLSTYGKYGAGVLNAYTGGASGAVTTSILGGDQPPITVSSPQGGGSDGGGFPMFFGAPASNTQPAWLIPAAIGVGVLALAFVLRK